MLFFTPDLPFRSIDFGNPISQGGDNALTNCELKQYDL